ncbi:hypothetical protein ACPROK_10585 [Glutamicibacter soli]|uniref:Uncharacterized protein n=3 Tax=Glutamicibacter TaxID=1742989 RepID=A0A6L9G3V0_9MICC|nr:MULTISPECIES: hypothetical protein [Micrococcaceae]MBP2398336.1 hypothetical protein [Glutamicibacter protophormiae]NAZ15894.1 hypothetical protein [Glutamicibacter soli]RKS17249.1 hypothetical protein DFO58_2862 [Arthrobacter sp. AG1021]GGL89547.1 hypothetical protein GCM10010038_19370 [Glutamicibacter protophormiae]
MSQARKTTPSANPIKRRTLAAALCGALLFAPVTGAASAIAQPSISSVQTVASSASTVSSGSIAADSGTRSVASPDLGTASASDAQKRISIKPVIDWIKKNAPQIWNSMKSAVKKGWNAFKKWWNSLASWIRWGIDFVASGGLWELFDALWHYFF